MNGLRIGVLTHNYPLRRGESKDAGRFVHIFAEELLAQKCVEKVLEIGDEMLSLEVVIVDDCSRRTLARWLGMFPPAAAGTRLPLLIAASFQRTFRSDYEGVD